jgi:probable F420-dependent oxidoreductase
MRLGLFLPTIESLRGPRWLPRWTELRDIAQLAEQVGFDALWVPDHLIFRASAHWNLDDADPRGTWEAWTVLAALAEATTRVEIGPYVNASSFRQPALLAKMAATLDEISSGRLILGLGTGSHQPEYPAFGLEWDHLASRFEEGLQISVPLLRNGSVDFRGRYYRAENCELLPRGPRPAGPPVWIAAFGPRMLRLAAQWGDGFITAWHTQPAEVETTFAALEAACRDVQRDPTTLTRAIGTYVSFDPSANARALYGSPSEIADKLHALAGAGASHITCMLTPSNRRGVEQFARVIEQLR